MGMRATPERFSVLTSTKCIFSLLICQGYPLDLIMDFGAIFMDFEMFYSFSMKYSHKSQRTDSKIIRRRSIMPRKHQKAARNRLRAPRDPKRIEI